MDGSCALNLCGVACGRLDVFYELGFGGPWYVATLLILFASKILRLALSSRMRRAISAQHDRNCPSFAASSINSLFYLVPNF